MLKKALYVVLYTPPGYSPLSAQSIWTVHAVNALLHSSQLDTPLDKDSIQGKRLRARDMSRSHGAVSCHDIVHNTRHV